MSIQAGETAYCTPRSNDAERYTEVELGFPSEKPPDYILEHQEIQSDDPLESVYPYVPIEKVVRWAAEKGGMKALPEHIPDAPEKADQ